MSLYKYIRFTINYWGLSVYCIVPVGFKKLWAQSRKRNRKAWDRCPSSLGGKFGKCNQGLRYRFLRDRCPGFLQAKWTRETGNDPKGIINRGLGYVFPNFPPIDNGQWSHALRFCLRDFALYHNPTNFVLFTLLIPSKASWHLFTISRNSLYWDSLSYNFLKNHLVLGLPRV